MAVVESSKEDKNSENKGEDVIITEISVGKDDSNGGNDKTEVPARSIAATMVGCSRRIASVGSATGITSSIATSSSEGSITATAAVMTASSGGGGGGGVAPLQRRWRKWYGRRLRRLLPLRLLMVTPLGDVLESTAAAEDLTAMVSGQNARRLTPLSAPDSLAAAAAASSTASLLSSSSSSLSSLSTALLPSPGKSSAVESSQTAAAVALKNATAAIGRAFGENHRQMATESANFSSDSDSLTVVVAAKEPLTFRPRQFGAASAATAPVSALAAPIIPAPAAFSSPSKMDNNSVGAAGVVTGSKNSVDAFGNSVAVVSGSDGDGNKNGVFMTSMPVGGGLAPGKVHTWLVTILPPLEEEPTKAKIDDNGEGTKQDDDREQKGNDDKEANLGISIGVCDANCGAIPIPVPINSEGASSSSSAALVASPAADAAKKSPASSSSPSWRPLQGLASASSSSSSSSSSSGGGGGSGGGSSSSGSIGAFEFKPLTAPDDSSSASAAASAALAPLSTEAAAAAAAAKSMFSASSPSFNLSLAKVKMEAAAEAEAATAASLAAAAADASDEAADAAQAVAFVAKQRRRGGSVLDHAPSTKKESTPRAEALRAAEVKHLKARLAAAEAKLHYNELLQGNHVDDPQESGVENDYWKADQAVDVAAAEITTLRAEIERREKVMAVPQDSGGAPMAAEEESADGKAPSRTLQKA